MNNLRTVQFIQVNTGGCLKSISGLGSFRCHLMSLTFKHADVAKLPNLCHSFESVSLGRTRL